MATGQIRNQAVHVCACINRTGFKELFVCVVSWGKLAIAGILHYIMLKSTSTHHFAGIEDHLFPFGELVGDQIVPPALDGSSAGLAKTVLINVTAPFFGTEEDTLFVCIISIHIHYSKNIIIEHKQNFTL